MLIIFNLHSISLEEINRTYSPLTVIGLVLNYVMSKKDYQHDLLGHKISAFHYMNDKKLIKNLFIGDNPFIVVAYSDQEEELIQEGFRRFLAFSGLSYDEFKTYRRVWQRQLIINQAFQDEDLKMQVMRDAALDDDVDPYDRFFDDCLYTDDFNLCWFDLALKGIADSVDPPSDHDWYEFDEETYSKLEGKDWFWDYYDLGVGGGNEYTPYEIKNKKLLLENLPRFLKFAGKKGNAHKRGWGMWKDYEFVRIITDYDSELLFDGPPSFHKNKKIHLKILAEHPDYYFKMRNRNLKKDKDITKVVIQAKPELLERIPRQYVSNFNPFVLTKITEKKPELAKKYIQPLKGIVCITGKLKSYKTKKEAREALEINGYAVSERLTQECNFLVNESNIKSSKSEKIKDWRYSHIKEIKDINKLIEENWHERYK